MSIILNTESDIAQLHQLGIQIEIPEYERPNDWLVLDTTLTGCSGAALSAPERAIATGKGWSIIG